MPRVRTAVIDAHEIDTAGLAAVLERYPGRIAVVDHGVGAAVDADVDVILYGLREDARGHDDDLHCLLRRHPATVILVGWRSHSSQVDWALACGAHGHLAKTLPGDDVVAGIEHLHRRRDRAQRPLEDGPCRHPEIRLIGLTPRELEVLELITAGLTNQEIADQAFLSINSVKTYVRTAYHKIGVTRRTQAVTWGIDHGLAAASSFAPAPVG